MGSNEQEGGVSGKQLAGKVAIVTGASRGIGRAIARRFAASGSKLVLTARSLEALRTTLEEVRAMGAGAEGVATPDGDPSAVVSTATSTFGRIDVLINNAGTTKTGDFISLTDRDWADGYQVKVFAAVRLARAAWPELKKSKGSVINLAGAGGHTPDARFTIGGSVNAAVMAFSKALAQLGIEDGVQVNCINPGLVRTDRLIHPIEHAMKSWSLEREAAEARMRAEYRISRFGEPEEIADFILYLLSPPGRIFQGAHIDADAGFTKGI